MSGTKGTFSMTSQTNTGQLKIGSSDGIVKLESGQELDRETEAFVVIQVE